MNEIEQQIENTLDKLRPFAGCMYIDQTLSSGIEVILCEEVPGVNAVKVVEEGLSM